MQLLRIGFLMMGFFLAIAIVLWKQTAPAEAVSALSSMDAAKRFASELNPAANLDDIKKRMEERNALLNGDEAPSAPRLKTEAPSESPKSKPVLRYTYINPTAPDGKSPNPEIEEAKKRMRGNAW